MKWFVGEYEALCLVRMDIWKMDMKRLSELNLRHLCDLAERAAREAGKMIAAARPVSIHYKEGGDSLASQILTKVDEQSQALILSRLEPTLAEFDLALLTEERPDDGSRFEKDYFWCIDPLDGTLPFVEGIPGYSVSIALVARDGTSVIGVVFDPVTRTLYSAVRGQGAFKNSVPWLIARNSANYLSLITDRSFEQHPRFLQTLEELEVIAADLGLSGGVKTRMTGGAAMNAIWVLESDPACYFKFPKAGNGGGSLWDYAATSCIYGEIGAVATDGSGAPQDLNRSDSTFMNHRGIVCASNHQLAEQILNLF
ncbi:MAG: hypothetical protein OEL75_03645 [Kiritimatiellaceae bacterium]|nr:hypothetical protein [Kiritimatiellaceae bacterium]